MKNIKVAILGLICICGVTTYSMERSSQDKEKSFLQRIGKATKAAFEWSMQTGIDHDELQEKIKQRHYENGSFEKTEEMLLLSDQQKK